MLLVLPSCAHIISPLRSAAPAPDLPATFKGTTSPENSAQLGIAEFFNDPTLTRLLDQALVDNRELRILNEEVQIARNEILARQGAYLPFFTLGALAGLDKPSLFTPMGAAEDQLTYPPGKHFPDPLPNYNLGINLLWQVDIWRELRNARDAAAQRYVAANEKRNYFVTRLVNEVAENYYGLMARDKRLENLDQIIKFQKQSLELATARFKLPVGAKLGALPVKRFEAEINKNQSQLLITRQEIVQVENRINFLLNRFPQPVERNPARFFDLTFPVSVGVPAQLLLNRPDVRQAERELQAAGLDIKVARAHFFPKAIITGGVGYQAFDPRYLFLTPEALIGGVAGQLVTPLINFKAIRAEYYTANAKQLQSVYNYQRVILNAYTEVYNRVSKVENYSKSIAFKKQQVEALSNAVDVAMLLFKNARVEYLDVLFAQRDLWDARFELIETRQEQLFAIVSVYQALGGGQIPFPDGPGHPGSHFAGEENRPEQLPPPRLFPPVPVPFPVP
jgi:NodT family efflux transporter outer membrane factor (OMF) lipoprotein